MMGRQRDRATTLTHKSNMVAGAFLAAGSMALAKDYQVTGPVVDVKRRHHRQKRRRGNDQIQDDRHQHRRQETPNAKAHTE